MAFTSTITQRSADKGFRIHMGTWTTDTTTGDINTGLTTCVYIQLQATGSSIVADAPTVDETIGDGIAGSAITIICTSATAGNWIAWGY